MSSDPHVDDGRKYNETAWEIYFYQLSIKLDEVNAKLDTVIQFCQSVETFANEISNVEVPPAFAKLLGLDALTRNKGE